MLYRLIIFLRNLLYDKGILRSYYSSLQTISVGNLAVGGTGKTPHSEMIIRDLLGQGKKVAYLSRGYKRTSKGMVVATPSSTSFDLGDEALQVHKKFPEVMVVVDKNRVRALRYLEVDMDEDTPFEERNCMPEPRVDVVVMDDAFQHRKVTPSTSIVLIDWSMDIEHEKLLPYGRLREPISGLRRADMVIFTKCPPIISDEERDARIALVNRYGKKKVEFSRIVYDNIDIQPGAEVLLLTAIENPTPLVNHLESLGMKVEMHKYLDHHRFTDDEIAKAKATNKPIITTEKDWCRMNCPAGFAVVRIHCESF